MVTESSIGWLAGGHGMPGSSSSSLSSVQSTPFPMGLLSSNNVQSGFPFLDPYIAMPCHACLPAADSDPSRGIDPPGPSRSSCSSSWRPPQ